jgi:lipoyl(octanoyl) transferase
MMREEILVARSGLVPYAEARATQQRLATARQREEVPDLLWLLEHPPVYTRGRRSDPEELPMGVEWYELQGIEVHDTDRGGRVTYHGPGQLVAYPIVSLRPYGDDVQEYVRRLERATIGALADLGLGAGTISGLTGVWTAGRDPFPEGATEASAATEVAAGGLRKIGSIGVHVSRGVTTHGLAVNVDNDLQPFEWIVPCGIGGARMTSIGRELGGAADLDAFAGALVARFGSVFDRVPVPADLDRLAGDGSPARPKAPGPLPVR